MDGLSRQVLDGYQEILKLTQEQNKLCDSQEFDNQERLVELSQILAARQGMIDQISRWEAELTTSDPVFLTEKKDVLTKIMQLDSAATGKFGDTFTDLKNQLRKIKAGRQGNRAYYSRMPQVDGHFIDTKK